MPSSGFKKCALRSEEHTSELQSHDNFVCRLLLEKNKKQTLATDPGHNTIASDQHFDNNLAENIIRSENNFEYKLDGKFSGDTVYYFFFKGTGAHRILHSFPPRPSSD